MKLVFLLLIMPFFIFAEIDLRDFDALMGKQTRHWRYVTQPQDLLLLENVKQLYAKNYKLQLIETDSYKIPPVIHFIWIGPRVFPAKSVENVRMWIAQNPGWKVKFWTDREREAPCAGMEVVQIKDFYFAKLGRYYEDSENWGEKSDLLRYEILCKEGGVYVDHDANCLRPFSPLHQAYDFFCCLEPPHEPFVGRNITCGNAILGSRPRHPVLEKIIDLIAKRWDKKGKKFQGKDEYSKIEVVMQRTYIAVTDALEGALDKVGNTDIVFPAAYFFSKSEMPSIYSKHFFATTWKDSHPKKTSFEMKAEKVLGRIRHKSHLLTWMIGGLIGVNLILLTFFYTRKRI